MWSDLWAALALMLVFEGIMPFISPAKWRDGLQTLMQLPNQHLRWYGLFSMLAGVVLLYWAR